MRCRTFRISLAALLLIPLLLSAPALASHETIVIDGNLADLITAVNNNLGASNGGFTAPNALGNIYSSSCSFVNGFDIRNTWVLFDFKDANGDYTPNDVTLYLGWQVQGAIGDVDGDGNPNTYTATTNFTCANNGDQAGIGPFEAYFAFIDLCGTPVPVAIQNNMIFLQTNPGVPLPGATFALNGSFLEVKIPNLQNYLPGGSLCGASIFLTANSQFDGLGEDTSPQFDLSIAPVISVSKDPAVQSVCIGSDVSWTIVVKNDGLCVINALSLRDTLETGMTFVSSNPPSTGDTQIRDWSFTELAPGDSVTVTLTANAAGPCGDGLENRVTAEGTTTVCTLEPIGSLASDAAIVTCEVPNVTIDKTLSTHSINSDGTVTVTLLITNTGQTVLDPVQVCDQLDPKTTIDLMQTPGGTCNVGFVANNNIAGHICFDDFSLDPTQSCTITYVVGCGETGTHVDTASVAAYCSGTFPNNPLIVRDNDSFVCQNNMGFACPHTIGFWRQQCAQKGNGSTKVCLTGMQLLWRCVIENTDVIQWKKNDGSFETTATLEALSNANLFTALCSQLQGPRPMTIRDMTEIQYLGLMLNVCSGALPLNVIYAGSGMGDLTVQEVIDGIENALNTNTNLDYWKTLADNINNRLDLLAEDCPDPDLFRHLPGCEASAPDLNPAGDHSNVLETRAYPNPIVGKSTSIFYRIPSGNGASPVAITVFDLSGRAVRNLVSGVQNPGDYSTEWNLQDDGGSAVTSGIYFYRISVGGETVTQKIMVLAR